MIKWVLKIIAVPLIAYFCSIAFFRMSQPQMSDDLKAYVELLFAIQTDDVNRQKAFAKYARSYASDERLVNLADEVCTADDTFVAADIAKTSEMNSSLGYCKVAEYTISHPEIFPKAFIETVRTWNMEQQWNQIVQIYQPQFEDYGFQLKRAENWVGKILVWGTLSGYFILYGLWINGKQKNTKLMQ